MKPSSAIKKLVRPVVAPPRALYQYARALKIVRDYARNYTDARSLFERELGAAERVIPALAQTGVRLIQPPHPQLSVTLPADYESLVERLGVDVSRRFERSGNCSFMPKIDRDALPERTADVPAVRNGDVISLQLKDCTGLDGLAQLADALLPGLERCLYGSFVVVDKVYVYRNLISRQQEQVSWLWHYDNHPTEILKVMIYLTDVDEGAAPFEYLRDATTGRPWVFTPRPLLGHSRISSKEIRRRLDAGYERVKVTGPKGTLVIFDDNVAHKANIATTRQRDVVVLQLRPATFHPTARLDPRWSGSFEHVDFNTNPDDYAPRVKTTRLSG